MPEQLQPEVSPCSSSLLYRSDCCGAHQGRLIGSAAVLLRKVLVAAFTFALCLTTRSVVAESENAERSATEAVVRSIIAKSLPYIEEQGLYWIEKKKCVSCHRVSFMTWSLSAAARRGFDVDLMRVNEWIDWSIADGIPVSRDDKPAVTNNADGLSQQLLSRHEYPAGRSREESWSRYVELIVETQRKDGTWKPAGQLSGQKRPQQETTDVSTAWHALALSRALNTEKESARKESIRSALAAAREKFSGRQQAVSTEWYVVQLLLAVESGDEDAVANATNDLLSFQKPNGSWGWLTADPGDALGTGMSLYALAVCSGPDQKQVDAVQRAIRFLKSTQREDGSWPVKGTKLKKKEKVEETAVYWGTTWAVIGLLETLPVVD